MHIGRQPIYDPRGRIAGYELLFRGSAGAEGAARRGAYATSQVIVNAFTEFGLENLVGSDTCFINLTREFVTGDLPLPFPPGPVVLEILESVPVDDQVVSGILKLVDTGYRVALDDFVLGQGHEQLLTVASYVKINFSAREPDALAESVGRCRRYPKVRLIAERVETVAQIRRARRLRFDLLQGYALQQPQTLSTTARVPDRMRLIQLFSAINAPDVDEGRVASIVAGEPIVGAKVVRALRSLRPGCSGQSDTLDDAVAAIGMDRVRQWVSLVLICAIPEANDEYLDTIVTRARLCRTVGERLNVPGDVSFTVGLLAGIADLLDEPIADIVAQLPLATEVGDALARGTGKLGKVLAAVRAYERRDLAALASGAWSGGQLAMGRSDRVDLVGPGGAVGGPVDTADAPAGGDGRSVR